MCSQIAAAGGTKPSCCSAEPNACCVPDTARNEQCSLFGEHVFVFVLFVWSLVSVSEHARFVFGCVRCFFVFGHCDVVFGVRFRRCVLFDVRASQLSESCPDDHHTKSSYMMTIYDDHA